MFKSLVWPDSEWNPKSTATETDALSTSPSEQLNLIKTIFIFYTHHNKHVSKFQKKKNNDANVSTQG